MSDLLSAAEAQALTDHEVVIERGIKTFYEVGKALADIRDRKLYRADHGTFEEYAESRWQISRPRAYELIAAAEVVSGIPDTLPPPTNAGQAVALARIPEPERAEVWAATVERTDGKPTAAAVRETYEHSTPEPNVWVQPGEPEFERMVTPPQPAPEQPKRKTPLPEAFLAATLNLTKAAESLVRLTSDDRFTRNRDQAHHQMPELLGALNHTTQLMQALNLPAAEASEEARRWWATSLNTISDALTGVANSITKDNSHV